MKKILKNKLVELLQYFGDSILERMYISDELELQKLYEMGMLLDIYTNFSAHMRINN